MPGLQFQLFGNHCVVRRGSDQEEIRLFPAARCLLAYLLIYRHESHSREMLADVFWQYDEQRARKCLRTTLWRLRSELEGETNAGCYLLVSAQGDIAFNSKSDHWLDVAAFEEGIRRGLTTPASSSSVNEAAVLEAACTYYRGDLLQSIYDDWAIRERERLRLLYLQAMSALLAHYCRQGAYEQGLLCGQRILEMDPLRENVHRELMRLYMHMGQRALGVRQYELCRAVLADELGIEPMPETKAVFQWLTSEDEFALPPNRQKERPVSLQQAVQQVAVAMQAVEQTQAQLKKAMGLLLRLVERPGRDEATRPKR